METIRTRDELKAMAKQQLRGNWGKAILICVILSAIVGVLQLIPIVGAIVVLSIEGSLTLGMIGFFLGLARRENVRVGQLFDGFARFGSSLALLLLSAIFVMLWSLLLIVPGIIASLSYSMAFFILRDHPDMEAMEALRRSKQMMRGHKWRFFVLGLSFIGWALLCVVTVGIGLLWLIPYIYATQANFYENLRQAQPQVLG